MKGAVIVNGIVLSLTLAPPPQVGHTYVDDVGDDADNGVDDDYDVADNDTDNNETYIMVRCVSHFILTFLI